MRFLTFLAVAFILYHVAKGVFRRLLAPPPSSRRPDLERQTPSRRDLDYSKIKDATYREVERGESRSRGVEESRGREE